MTPKERAAVSIQNESETVNSLSTMRTAMQQALEALEEYRDTQMIKAPRRAITALREALARDNMSPTEHAVIQQALEHKRSCAYKRIDQNPSECTCGVTEALTALREALDHSGEANEMVGCAYCNNPLFAGTKCNNCGRVTLAKQAEQEPVGMVIGGVFEPWNDDILSGAHELYAAPVPTKDLTDHEIDAIDDANWENENKTWNIKKFARAVIAADREKNK